MNEASSSTSVSFHIGPYNVKSRKTLALKFSRIWWDEHQVWKVDYDVSFFFFLIWMWMICSIWVNLGTDILRGCGRNASNKWCIDLIQENEVGGKWNGSMGMVYTMRIFTLVLVLLGWHACAHICPWSPPLLMVFFTSSTAFCLRLYKRCCLITLVYVMVILGTYMTRRNTERKKQSKAKQEDEDPLHRWSSW